jgi:hypothetical protein
MDVLHWIKDLPPLTVAWAGVAIALASALFTAISSLVSWKAYRRDRPHVYVELQWNAEDIHGGGMRSPTTQRKAHIIVRNKGRRPMGIEYIGLKLPGHVTGSANWLEESVKLSEGDPPIIIKIVQDSTLEPFVPQWRKIEAWVSTSDGRWHKSRQSSQPPLIIPGCDFETVNRLQDFGRPELNRVAQRPQTKPYETQPEKRGEEIELDRRRISGPQS